MITGLEKLSLSASGSPVGVVVKPALEISVSTISMTYASGFKLSKI